MLFISQVDLEIGGCHLWARRVELAGTVSAPDPRQEHPLDILWCWLSWLDLWRRDDNYVGVGVHGAVSHRGFKGVVGPGFSQIGEGVDQPLWGRWLL